MGCPFNYCFKPDPDCPRCEEVAEARAYDRDNDWDVDRG